MSDGGPAARTLRPVLAQPSDAAVADLARSAAAGDALATRQLLELVAPRIGATARAVFGRAHPDVEDVVQQALIGFVQALPAFRGECDPRHFGARIAVRTAVAARRRARALAERQDDGADLDALPTVAGQPSAVALAQRRTTLLRELLAQLPDEQSEVLALRVVLGWTLEEVTTATGAPSNTVRSRLRLAKEALRRKILADPVLRDALEVDA